MSIFNRKKNEDESHTVAGECTRILNDAFNAVDETLAEKRAAKEAAKKVQERVAQIGHQLRLKQA